MASSASTPATRLSAARDSGDIECAKYNARLTNPNAIQSTMINTEPSWRAGRAVAHVFNMQYRRFPNGRPLKVSAICEHCGPWQVDNLRNSRLDICATES